MVPLTKSVPDVVAILRHEGRLTDEEYSGLRDWFAQYAGWLEQSRQGQYAGTLDNNHGSWFDVQIICCHLFLGNGERAREVLAQVGERRISRQIQPDGRQSAELVRSKAFDYSCYNLDALLTLCELGEYAGLDIWSYEAPSGASMDKALEYLRHYAERKSPLDRNLNGINAGTLEPLLLRAVHFTKNRSHTVE